MATAADMSVGDLVTARVTTVLPYGVLVESTTGVPGLVVGADADVDEPVRPKVTSVDVDKGRFSAEVAT